MIFTENCSAETERLKAALAEAEAVVIGAGAGLSTAAGFEYREEMFSKYFADFGAKYGFSDMYSGGFYPFESPEEYWAYWSRYIYINRYMDPPKPVYDRLFELVHGKNDFVITTNVDHCFQKAGFDKKKLFYTQGDYGLFQCSRPCHSKTYDNEDAVIEMVASQHDMKVPSELVPYCPVCGAPMTMNLRADDTFVEDEGWHEAAVRYQTFLQRNVRGRVLFLELGVGFNTPGIIKYPFMKMTAANPKATYACINSREAYCPKQIEKQSICIAEDIGDVLLELTKR